MCAADSTIEGNNSTPETGDIVPWGTKHVCNNFDAVRQWAEENRADHNPWPEARKEGSDSFLSIDMGPKQVTSRGYNRRTQRCPLGLNSSH